MLTLPLVAIFFFASTLSMGQSETQRPELTQCRFTKKAMELKDLVVEDLALGHDMKLNFSGRLLEEVVGEPSLKFTMWNSYNVRMPCIEDYGSCTYKLCGGIKEIEKMGSVGWNNTCPILPGMYETYLKLPVIAAAKYVRGNGTFRVKFEAMNGKEVMECKTFHVYLALK
ncbi:uncharacterized protein [Dermacentor albipictus]|uniref:uncharacterized protein isoform X1 n=1 Tax=Dermacentor albipictus TaxID=60249 RepID=UPI0038FCC3EE